MAKLSFKRICKRFGGTEALRDVSFEVNSGEVVALLGENGAGKSTLIKILGGVHTADSGSIEIDDQPMDQRRRSSGKERQAITFVHQDLGLIEWMTIAENVALDSGFPHGKRLPWLIDWHATDVRAAQALDALGCDIDPQTRVSALSRTEKSLVAIARALGKKCDFLVLDEPTASLPADEVETLFKAVRRLRDSGVGVIYVSHRLDEIFQIADRAVVLRDGQLAGSTRVADTDSGHLVDLIVGEGKLQTFEKANLDPETAKAGRVTVADFATEDAGPASFEVMPGEILGLVGLRGAGQEAIGRALFGESSHRGGAMIDGSALDLTTIGTALASGVGLIARDRTEESIAGALSVRENIFVNPGAHRLKALSFMGRRVERAKAIALGKQVGLRPNDPEAPIENLSGGNQQKVVVGRWLATNRRFLILEDPTAGVDIGAKAEIYRLIVKAVADGVAVVVVSTDFEEIAALCHRALVFNRGRIIAELAGDALTTQSVISAASASETAEPIPA